MRERYIGMVLSSATIGEFDKRVVILTKENGRFSAFARGARRPKSPLSAVTEPFCFGEFFIYKSRDSYTLDEVRAECFFPELRSDLDKLYMGMYFCEVADYFTREGMRASHELELLYRTLLQMTYDTIPIELIRRIYELRSLAIAGYAPLYHEDDKRYHDDKEVWDISDTAAYTIGQIISRPLNELYTFSVSERVLREIDKVTDKYLRRVTDRQFRSLSVLDAFEL